MREIRTSGLTVGREGATLPGYPTDRDTREPLAGELTLLSDGEMASDFGEADATGVHVFPHVPYGRYQLSATAELHAARQIPLVVGKGRTATELVLDPEQLLSGEVRGADGRALAGAEVQLASAASEQTAETGTDGHFELHGLGPGEHHLRVSHPRHLSASVKTVLPQLAPLLVTLRAAATLTVEVVTSAGTDDELDGDCRADREHEPRARVRERDVAAGWQGPCRGRRKRGRSGSRHGRALCPRHRQVHSDWNDERSP